MPEMPNNQRGIEKAICTIQRQTDKHCFSKSSHWRNNRKENDIHGNMEEPLGKNFNVGKQLKFIKERKLFEVI